MEFHVGFGGVGTFVDDFRGGAGGPVRFVLDGGEEELGGFGAEVGADAIADGEDGFEAIVEDGASELAFPFGSNY